jgi:hypothetical protein
MEAADHVLIVTTPDPAIRLAARSGNVCCLTCQPGAAGRLAYRPSPATFPVPALPAAHAGLGLDESTPAIRSRSVRFGGESEVGRLSKASPGDEPLHECRQQGHHRPARRIERTGREALALARPGLVRGRPPALLLLGALRRTRGLDGFGHRHLGPCPIDSGKSFSTPSANFSESTGQHVLRVLGKRLVGKGQLVPTRVDPADPERVIMLRKMS